MEKGLFDHWDAAYASGAADVSWYQPHADISKRLIERDGSVDNSVIDVGGGASSLVDDLLAAGYSDITVLDISAPSLAIAEARLGADADVVTWIAADLMTWQPARTFSIWHDRAVLHFLTDPEQQILYRESLMAATAPGSVAVIGVFGPGGPTSCSGLAVRRYDPEGIARLLGSAFAVASCELLEHRTPGGSAQQFLWTRAVRTAAVA